METPNKLNRFTSLPILLDILINKKLRLSKPDTWEDKNDSEVLISYQEKINKKVFVICFSYRSETIHLWKNFSNGIDGCVIEFDFNKLVRCLEKTPHLRYKKIQYKYITEIPKIKFMDIPFTKRKPYRIEEEYRILAEIEEDLPYFEIGINYESINKITFNQNMPKNVFLSVKKCIKEIVGNVPIIPSTVYRNNDWIEGLNELIKKEGKSSS